MVSIPLWMSSNGLSQCNVARDAASQALHLKLDTVPRICFFTSLFASIPMNLYPLVNIQKTMENHQFLMGKSTISTGPFSSSLSIYVYQAGYQGASSIRPETSRSPMRWPFNGLVLLGKLTPESPIFNGNIYGFHTNQMLFTIFNGY